MDSCTCLRAYVQSYWLLYGWLLCSSGMCSLGTQVGHWAYAQTRFRYWCVACIALSCANIGTDCENNEQSILASKLAVACTYGISGESMFSWWDFSMRPCRSECADNRVNGGVHRHVYKSKRDPIEDRTRKLHDYETNDLPTEPLTCQKHNISYETIFF